MARPRNKIFYEHAPLESIPPGQEWLPAYETNSRKVIDYLSENHAGSTMYHGAIRCLTELKDYLVKNKECYSSVTAENWYRNTGPYPKGYLATLQRLQDYYGAGVVRPIHSFPVALPYYARLKGFWKEQLDRYLASIEMGYAPSYLISIRNCAARFLYAVQEAGLKEPGEITFDFLDNYLSNDAHVSVHSKNRYGYSISDILLFMADAGFCEHGKAWYANVYVQGKVHPLSECPEEFRLQAESRREESQDFSAEQFALLIPDFLERLKNLGYSNNHLNVAHGTLYSLLVFLSMHSFGYHPDIAKIWLELEKPLHKSLGWKAKRRFLDLFEEYTQEGDFRANKPFRKKPLRSELLPDWCKETLDRFLHQKKKEGWEASTVCMVRSSVTRFCEFLSARGLSSFAEITPSLISEFNRVDQHLTAEGKNAYNVRIRKFIRFLEMDGVIPFGTSEALLCAAAATEKNVVILSPDEEGEITKKTKAAEKPIELRDKVVLSLGLEMGIRSIDIVGINLEDIDWSKQVIRILQKKTSHEIHLPMPTKVGNAIYTYIKNGRPKSGSNALILSTKAPYERASRAVCRAALRRALPERRTPRSGFHVTRKTFATKQIRKSAGMDAIADMLGHRTRANLFQYLNLDSEKMRLCAISLKDAHLEMEDNRYD